MLLILLFPVVCLAQHKLEKANRYYDNLAFAEAVPVYQKVLKSDPTNSEAIFRIAHCYRLINDMKEAEKWYSKAIQLKESKPAHLVYYTEALMSNGHYTEAENWIMKYRQIAGADSRTDKIIESLQNINSFVVDSAIYSIQKLSINSENADCSPVIYNKGIVFSSSRRRIEFVQQIHDWTDRPFFTLYYAKGEGINFKSPEIFASSITTKFNNATICFNKAEDELFITRNNVVDGNEVKSDSGVVKLNIYHFNKAGSKWIDEASFQYNSNQYNCAHPCLSPDGNKLFFASDMPGGFGGLDIYVCTKNGKSWDKPENLGPNVNTSGNDCFPFIDVYDGLYYASNGKGGLGGHDIFYSSKSYMGFTESENLGYPINSPGDDFGLVQNETGTSGYFSSNREGKGQNDDIYSFNRLSVPLNLLVYDLHTKMPLTATTVTIIESGKQKRILNTSEKGTINFFMTPGKNYKFIAEMDKYNHDSARVDPKTLSTASVNHLSIGLRRGYSNIKLAGKIYSNNPDKKGMPNVKVSFTDKETGKEVSTTSAEDGSYKFENLTLEGRYTLEAKMSTGVSYPIEVNTVGLDDNKTLNNDIVLNSIMDVVKIENIFYDLNKSDVRPDAEATLNRLVEMMKSNPEMKIELRSHTDCRQNDNYNLKLSNKRAKSVVAYLTKKGISSSRLAATGYGESMLINQCDCEGIRTSPCSEEEHQANRRTEFKILTLN